VTSDNPQPVPPFGVPENPLAKAPTENPYRRTRPVRRAGPPRPLPIGRLMPDAAIEMRRRMFEVRDAAWQAAIAEDIERTADQ
jgi:hypothetical protein